MKGTLRRMIGGKQMDYPRLMYIQCSPFFCQQIEQNKSALVGKHDENCKVKYAIKNHLPEAHYAVWLSIMAWLKVFWLIIMVKLRLNKPDFSSRATIFM